jgi:hypothetical protein
MPAKVTPRRLSAALGRSRSAQRSFIVKDATGQALAYCYFEDEPQRQMSMRQLSKDEASRLEANFACRTCSMGRRQSPLRSHVGPMRLVLVGLDTRKRQRLWPRSP